MKANPITGIAKVITEDPNVYDYSDENVPNETSKFQPKFVVRRLHRQVLAVAKTRIEGTWAAYVFPVPGQNHDEEMHLWKTEGSKMLESYARVMFPEFKDMKYAR